MKMDPQVQKLTPKGRGHPAADHRRRGRRDPRQRRGRHHARGRHGAHRDVEESAVPLLSRTARTNCCSPSPSRRRRGCSATSSRTSSQLTSWAAWQRWRDAVVERYRRQGQQCPLSTVMSEIGRTPGAQAVTSTLIDRWRYEIEAGVRAMQAQGKIAAGVDPTRAAAALLAGIQGGVLGAAEHRRHQLPGGRTRRRHRCAAALVGTRSAVCVLPHSHIASVTGPSVSAILRQRILHARQALLRRPRVATMPSASSSRNCRVSTRSLMPVRLAPQLGEPLGARRASGRRPTRPSTFRRSPRG